MDSNATMRVVIGHFTDKFGTTVQDFAETCRIGRDRLQEYMDGDDNALPNTERSRLSNFAAELVNAEKQELDDAKFFQRPEPSNIWKKLQDLEGE